MENIEITWNETMLDSEGELINNAGVFDMFGYKWAAVALYNSEKHKYYVVYHYKTGMKTGFEITVEESPNILNRFKDWIKYKDRIDEIDSLTGNLPEQN